MIMKKMPVPVTAMLVLFLCFTGTGLRLGTCEHGPIDTLLNMFVRDVDG